MKKNDVIAVGLLLVLFLSWWSIARAQSNNDMIGLCVGAYDTWSDRSRCFHDWKVEDNRRKYAKEKEYTDMRPWYYGRNYNWERDAEQGYTCERIYNNALMNTIEICSRPIFIN